jgi:hypothetical protein
MEMQPTVLLLSLEEVPSKSFSPPPHEGDTGTEGGEPGTNIQSRPPPPSSSSPSSNRTSIQLHMGGLLLVEPLEHVLPPSVALTLCIGDVVGLVVGVGMVVPGRCRWG